MRKFKTESKRLLDLMINSIYTNREIFLRELISNASDAVDKLYFKSLTDESVSKNTDDFAIFVDFDKEARTITVSDSGIGMDADDLEKNLGTIAHSGSREFKEGEEVSSTDAVDIIGQFGVGFYSAFMVAKEVQVLTKRYGSDDAFIWKSDGMAGYTISPAEKESHGTDVVLTLKDNTETDNYDEYLSEAALRELIKRYSNYVRYPIKMNVTRKRPLPKPENAPEDYQVEYEDYVEEVTINSMVPIWKRRKSEVTQEEYNEFYKTEFHDFIDPLRTIPVHAEGLLSYDALLFIPGRTPNELYTRDYEKGLSLYSSNVLIMEKCADLLPDYYNFVQGVVDSADLNLNISRETLQRDNQLRAIGKRIEKKIHGELIKMRDQIREDYELFFNNFGRSLKLGLYLSYGEKKDEIGELLLFYSAREEKLVTFDEYIESMSEGQKDIYFATGESLDRINKLPIVKSVLSHGYDVLLCTEDLDEFCMTSIQNYNEKDLTNVAKSDLDLATDDEKKVAEEATEQNADLLTAMQEILKDSVEQVRISVSLMDAPARLSTSGPISLEMERILKKGPHADMIQSERVLEINPTHKAFEKLKTAFDEDNKERLDLYTDLLYNQALLVEGMQVEDPVKFAAEIAELM